MLLGCHESPLIVGFHDDDQFPSITLPLSLLLD